MTPPTYNCPHCGTTYTARQVYTYIRYTCVTCGGVFKRVGQTMVKAGEISPYEPGKGNEPAKAA